MLTSKKVVENTSYYSLLLEYVPKTKVHLFCCSLDVDLCSVLPEGQAKVGIASHFASVFEYSYIICFHLQILTSSIWKKHLKFHKEILEML